jgi:hypothetical protein
MKSALEVIGQANFDTITEWVRLLDSLANDAEALAADEPHCAADQTSYSDRWCALGDRWFSLLWASMTPAFIAQSARRARAELRPVEVRLQPPLTDEEKAEDTARAVAMAKTAAQIETPKTEKPELEDWGDYSERKRAEREAAVMAQQERILAAAAAAPVPLVEPDPDELPPAWQPEPIEQEPTWVTSIELAQALNASRASMSAWNGKGLFHGMTRTPATGEGKGQRFHLTQCRAAYEGRPSRLNRNRPKAPVPLPVVVEDLPPAVEPTPLATESPAGPGAADAAALLELAGGDEATLAALRALLTVSMPCEP